MLELWVFRHPSSIWNENGIQQGQCRDEPGLSSLGLLQAQRIAEYLRQFNLAGIWSSPLPRAVKLAEIIQEHQTRPTTIFLEDDLMEMSHGVADGLEKTEIKALYPFSWNKWQGNNLDPDLPCFIGGETPKQVAERGVKALYRIAQAAYQPFYQAEPAVVISHGALLCFSFAKICNESLEKAIDPNKVLKNGSLSILTWNGRQPFTGLHLPAIADKCNKRAIIYVYYFQFKPSVFNPKTGFLFVGLALNHLSF